MKASIAESLKRLPAAANADYPEGAPFVTAMAGGSMRVEVFAPGSNLDGQDRQQPHTQDELYFVQAGTGEILINGQRFDAAAGDAFFVAAGTEHRFENFSRDFVTWVVFYGPQGGESEMKWTQARRAEKMNPSVLREILKVTEKPGIISFAGGLPSPKTFPVAAFAAACEKVLREDGNAALQYAASEGYAPLREMVAAMLPWEVDPDQVLITTGSQQGLDLIAKVLIDEGSRILVETPTYLGALQAFTPMEPEMVSVASDDEGVVLADLVQKAEGARFLYVLPNFQNPTGRSMSEARRAALSSEAERLGLPIVEDNPYGDLWFDAPPPMPLTARNPEGCVYLGSFSKVLAPGLRLGFAVAPKALYPKLLQAKQAADLHSPGFNQRMVAEVMKDGFLDRHVPTIRALYKSQRDAMLAALQREMRGVHGDLGVDWNTPAGGMFLWLRLPEGLSAADLLPVAVARGVAFVPGAAFYAGVGDTRTLRLSFVTASVAQIDEGMAALAAALREQLDKQRTARAKEPTAMPAV